MNNKLKYEIKSNLKKLSDNHPLKIAQKQNSKYYCGFIKFLINFHKVNNDSDKNIKSIIAKIINCETDNIYRYLQVASEFSVLNYVVEKVINNEWEKFIYEPKYNEKKNPECSFKIDNKIVNIEVKCPDMRKMKAEEEAFIKIEVPVRVDGYKRVEFDIRELNNPDIALIHNQDNKLKDYLISAQSKFPLNDEKYFNILVVALESNRYMDKWYNYIFGDGGVFSKNSFVSEDYSHVHAVLLTDVTKMHVLPLDKSNIWDMGKSLNLLFLNPSMQETYIGDFYFKVGMFLFGGNTYNFLKYVDELSNDEKMTNSENPLNQYRKYSLISHFVDEYLKNVNKHCNERGVLALSNLDIN